MLLPVPHSSSLTRVGIAILAKMGTCVVLPNVFADDATTELPLPFVFVVFFTPDINRIGYLDGIFRNNCSEVFSKVCHNLHSEEIH